MPWEEKTDEERAIEPAFVHMKGVMLTVSLLMKGRDLPCWGGERRIEQRHKVSVSPWDSGEMWEQGRYSCLALKMFLIILQSLILLCDNFVHKYNLFRLLFLPYLSITVINPPHLHPPFSRFMIFVFVLWLIWWWVLSLWDGNYWSYSYAEGNNSAMRRSPIFQMKREYEKNSESYWVAPEDINTSDLPCLAPPLLMIYPSDSPLPPPFKAECVTSLLLRDSWLSSCSVLLASLLVQVHSLLSGRTRFFRWKKNVGLTDEEGRWTKACSDLSESIFPRVTYPRAKT